MEFLTLKHSMPCGDLLSILPGLKKVWEDTGRKWIIYQRVNLEYGDMYGAYIGAKYSIKNDKDVPVTMNRAVFQALKPLLLHQEYIEDLCEWGGHQIDYNFDLLRQMDTTMPMGAINRWPWYVWPEMSCDLSKPWLENYVEKDCIKNRILINRTERYNNMLLSYHFLKKYGSNVSFIGLAEEHEKFNKDFGLNTDMVDSADFYKIDMALRYSKLFIGNQSAIFQIAEGLKTPRILEVCKQIPNVIGSGTGFYDVLTQQSLEYYVSKLYNE